LDLVESWPHSYRPWHRVFSLSCQDAVLSGIHQMPTHPGKMTNAASWSRAEANASAPCIPGRSAASMARAPPGPPSASGSSDTSASSPASRRQGNGVLRLAFLVVGLLLAYQLTVTLLQPAWVGAVSAWLQLVVGWSALLVVGWVSHAFTHLEPRLAASWWWATAGLLFYALGRTVWLVKVQLVYPYHVPVVSWLDLLLALQYPCFLLALLLVPRVRPRIQRTLWVLDACLLLGAAFALSWYFLLAPIYLSSRETPLAKL